MTDDAPAPPGSRPPWRAFRAALDAAGFRPSRRLGQNFLLDENVARAIARDGVERPGGEAEGPTVLEVGSGCGFLTVHLVDAGARVIAVEIDRRLAEVAREFVAPRGAVEWIRADVLRSKHELEPRVAAALPRAAPWQLVSNLPYSVASPLLVVLSRLANPPRAMTVLVQAEVAERLAAEPGQGAWGPLGIRVQALYRAAVLRRVPPQAFWPRPRVDSAVVRLDRRGRVPGDADLAALDRLVAAVFGTRRKTLRSSVGRLLGSRSTAERILESRGISGDLRPEELGLDALLELARAASEGGGV